jgi:hypothetical protein
MLLTHFLKERHIRHDIGKGGSMRGFFLIICFLFQSAPSVAQSVRDNQAIAIGPWLIEAGYRNGKFERCIMSRTTEEGIEARLTREGGGLTLAMTSPRWRLEPGKTYPIELVAGAVTWETKVAATLNTVRVPLTEARFNDGLRVADILEVRGAGSAIRVPLDKSAAGMERLERCYENNMRSTETNPFIAPRRRP